MEAIITSMTAKEREKPSLINPSRKRRIAAGSGTKVEDVNRVLRQYEQMQKMLKQLSKSGRNEQKAAPHGRNARYRRNARRRRRIPVYATFGSQPADRSDIRQSNSWR